MRNQRPTAERVRSLLNYDPVTGVFHWRATLSNRGAAGTVAGAIRHNGYRSIGIDGHYHQAARLAWLMMTGEWPARFIDHMNGRRADDRWDNLREASALENQRNRRPRNKFKGVSLQKNTWRARIHVGGQEISIGRYSTAEDAAHAYDTAARKHFGAFAFLNFPDARGADA